MAYYFVLQWVRCSRWLREAGLHPLIGLLIGGAGFGLLSALWFERLGLAHWLYPLLAVALLLPLGGGARNHRLVVLFGQGRRRLIRVAENGLVVLPFLLVLLWRGAYLPAAALLPVALLLALLRTGGSGGRAIPTPFGRRPFEFPAGFRQSVVLVLLLYFLLFKGVQVGNYNLAVSTIGGLFLLMLTFYLRPEPRYFVWLHSGGAAGFLAGKLRQATVCALLLAGPALLVNALLFPERLLAPVLVAGVGLILLLTLVLAKYATYPFELGLPQAVLFALCLFFPPALLLILPFFYRRARRNLNRILP